MAKIYGAVAATDQLAEKLDNLDADGNITPYIAKLYTIRSTVDDLERQTSNLDPNGNFGPMIAKLAGLGGDVQALAERLDNLRANVDSTPLLAKIVAAQGQVVNLARTMHNVPLTADLFPFEADILKATAMVDALKADADRIAIGSNLGSAANLGVIGSSSRPSSFASLGEVAGVDALGVAFTKLSMAERDAGFAGTIVSSALAGFVKQQTMIISHGTGFWGIMQTQLRTFGGALEGLAPDWLANIHLWHLFTDAIFEFAAAWAPALIAVGAFAGYAYPVGEKLYGQWENINVILDGVGGNLKDLGSGFDQIEKAIEPSVLIAFGEYMGIITHNSQGLGDALTKVGDVIDKWAAQAAAAVGGFEKSFDSIIGTGAKDFAEIGYGFEELGKILDNLFVHDMPGYVHILLALGDAALTVLSDVIQWTGPFIKVALAVHGFIVYVGLAATAVYALGRAMAVGALTSFAKTSGTVLTDAGDAAVASSGKFNKFGTAIGSFGGVIVGSLVGMKNWAVGLRGIAAEQGLAASAGRALSDVTNKLGNGLVMLPGITRASGAGMEVIEGELVSTGGAAGVAGGELTVFGTTLGALPLAGAVLGVAAVAAIIGVGLYAAMHQAQSAAEKLGTALKALITDSNASDINQNFALAISKTTEAIAKQTTVVSAAAKAQESAGMQNRLNPGAIWGQASAELNTYGQDLQTAVGYTQTYGTRMGQLTAAFGSNGAALGALNLMGIQAGKLATETGSKWSAQLNQLQALARGYGYMSQTSGAAGAQLSTLNIATGTTTKNIQTLTQAEGQWITMISGGDTAFSSFEQGFSAIYQAMGKAADSSQNITVKLGQLSEKIPAFGGTMNGLSASSLAVRSAFDAQLQSGTSLFGNLQTLAAASGNTAQAQKLLASGGKAIIAQMLPFAAGSKEGTAELSALAQLMGGPATSSFQVLAKWVGNTKGAEDRLNDSQAKLTISASNVTTAEKALGNQLVTDVTNMEAAKVATANLSGSVNGLYTASTTAHGQVTQMAVTLSGEYVTALKNAGLDTKTSEQYLNSYLKTLGYGPQAISEIDNSLGKSVATWQSYDKAVKTNTTDAKHLSAAVMANAEAFSGFYTSLPGTINQLNQVWTALVKQDQAMVASGKDTSDTKSEFVNFAMNGLNVTRAAADALWKKFGDQNLNYLASHAETTKSKFIDFAEHGLGLSQSSAQTLWGEFAQQNLDELASKGENAKDKFIDLAKNGLDLSNSAANALWQTLEHQYLDTLAGKAGETEGAFEQVASQFGLTKGAADKLWTSLHTLSAGSPYPVNVNETLTGSGSIKAIVSAAGVSINPGTPAAQAIHNQNVQNQTAIHGASGWQVPAGGTPAGQDGYHAVLAPGELVIPTSHAAQFGAAAKRAGIPGLASGGFIPTVPGVASTAQQGVPTMENAAVQYTASAMSQFATALNGAYQAAQGVGGAYGGPSSFGGGFESMGALLSYAKYFMQNGMTAIAAAGMAATISGEEDAAGPESRGDNGFGLLGWTGNTVGLPAGYSGPTGNVAYDLQEQLKGVIGYMNSRGGPGPLNAAKTPVQAGDIWSSYEAPKNALSDTRPSIANAIYAALLGSGGGLKTATATAVGVAGDIGKALKNVHLAEGGWMPGGDHRIRPHSGGGAINEPVFGTGAWSGMGYSFAENGQPEYVSNAGQAQNPGGNLMQPMTTYQGSTVTQQLGMLIKLWQQFPQALGNAMSNSGGNGVRKGYYGAQG